MPVAAEKQIAVTVGEAEEPVRELILRLLADLPTGKALEGAGGTGQLAAQLAAHGMDIVGADTIREMWQFADQPFVCCDMDAPLPFRDASFDTTLMAETLARSENPLALLREYHRVLKPSGSLVIVQQNILTLESRVRFLLNGTYRWYPHYQYQGEDKANLLLFNREPVRLTTLIFLLERAGFTIERIAFGGKPGYYLMLPFGLFFRVLTNIHNIFRRGRGKQTPAIVNSAQALLYRHVGVLARRKG